MATDFSKKNEQNYCCNLCDFNTSRLTDYNRHLLTTKHNGNKMATLGNEKNEKNEKYMCENCGKKYKDRTGLWKHNKKCVQPIHPVSNQLINKDELIMTLIQQNNELIHSNNELIKEQSDIKQIILEIVKNGTHTNNNNTNTHTNSHNKSFNLQFFLNETCKNAMNITDFVDSIKLELSDLMSVGDLGYVEGISKIILNNLNALDETVRPIHCTDKKRETMYIKDQGQWTKEDEKNTKLRKFVNRIADKNIYLLPKFREKFPDYNDSSSKTSDIYDKMVVEVMETCNDKKDKVIKHISRATFIHK